jgi:hypothetical protein
MPEVSTAANQPTSWFEKASGGGMKFQTVGQTQTTSMIPLYKLLDERYSVYWKVNTKAV